MATVTVYHGTSGVFKSDIETLGLIPPHGHGKGVRVTRNVLEAWAHARAWAAWTATEHDVMPKGIVAVAIIDTGRLLASDGVLRVPKGLAADEMNIIENEFDDLFDPQRLNDALDLFEKLTGRSATRRPAGLTARRS